MVGQHIVACMNQKLQKLVRLTLELVPLTACKDIEGYPDIKGYYDIRGYQDVERISKDIGRYQWISDDKHQMMSIGITPC